MQLNLEIDKKFREIETIISFLKLICDEKYGKINTSIKTKLIDIQKLLEENIKNSNIYLKNLTNQIDTLSRIKEDFITNINHQIRTPLTTIKGTLEFLEESIYDLKKEDILNRINRTKSSVESLTKLVYQLLDTSKFEKKEIKASFSEIDLTLEISELIKFFKKKFMERELKIDFIFPKDYKIPIVNDRVHIQKILSVIIENAFIYTEQGSISIKYDFNQKNKKEVEIEVTDTGIGISNLESEKIFKIFSRGETHSKEGLGLSLYIAYKFVALHGGKIKIKSKKNIGSTFKIFLPLHSKYLKT